MFTDEILHHEAKECISITHEALTLEERAWITHNVNGNDLTLRKWKKLYAVLADVGHRQKKNYRILYIHNKYYDTTSHSIYERQIDIPNTTYEAKQQQLGQIERMVLEYHQCVNKAKKMQAKAERIAERVNAMISKRGIHERT